MDCEKFDRVLMDLLYDELDELTRAAAARHTEHCQRCRGQLSQLRATRDASILALVEAPDGFEQRLLAAEEAARQQLPLGQRAARWLTIATGYAMRPQLAMAALLMLMIGSSLLLLRPKPGSQASAVHITELGTPNPNEDQVVVPVTPPGIPSSIARQGETPQEPQRPDKEPLPTRPQPAVERASVARQEVAQRSNSKTPSAVPLASSPNPSMVEQERSLIEGAPVASNDGADPPADEAIEKAEDDAYNEALQKLNAGDLDRARALFDAIASGGGSKAGLAELQAALTMERAQGCAAALPRFDSVSARQANNTLGNEATWRSATCRSKMGQSRRAMLDFEKLMKVPKYRSGAEKEFINLARLIGSEKRPAKRVVPGPPPVATTAPSTTPRAP